MPNLTLWGRVMGVPVRRVPSNSGIFNGNLNGILKAYLTFDDGPDPDFTPQVLDLLKQLGAKATFFVVSERARSNLKIIKRIQNDGHAIGNHSLDHRYSPFFKGYNSMKRWIEDSEKALCEMGIPDSVGFRPPVGIRTPELSRVLRDLNIPMILWEKRCFDGVSLFDEKKAKKIADSFKSGDIFLLHDKQKSSRMETFLVGLSCFIKTLKQRGYSFEKLDRASF